MRIQGLLNEEYKGKSYYEQMWNEEAQKLEGANEETINKKLKLLKKKCPEASMFWVNAAGQTKLPFPYNESLPKKWSSSYTAEFIKSRYGNDPYTVLAFIGADKKQGFMVIEVPEKAVELPIQKLDPAYYNIYLGFVFIIVLSFIVLSLFFFVQIRKRLRALQTAMNNKDEQGIPLPVVSGSTDEIGQLEQSFNQMVKQLHESRNREQQEEQLRQDLIMSLSHDLRTPLTTVRTHIYQLKNEEVTLNVQQALEVIDTKVEFVSSLIDNLFSYTLLLNGKYPYREEEIDMVRFLRKSIAQWYPLFEEANMEVGIQLSSQSIYWYGDVQWLERIIDNLCQNVIRHAKEGRFIGFRLVQNNGSSSLIIFDKGSGFKKNSETKQNGVGLAIVDAMIKEMELTWSIHSTKNGTDIQITYEARD
ncbi:HAMP domain-containing histidine kinase [Priestia aryabhattai]|uniref:sensor histidine kinase n=1 Tax=Priestia aryabhattai TaxID=412384 RepID=UPI0020405379|nr:HAMP domain-containing sensor histidine kinase [Priestia aryabhattai]MCM3772750.1 HAMP domain-containing histidine kinase [Priestia aryabhattai]